MNKRLLRGRWIAVVLGLIAFLGCASISHAGFIVPSAALTPGGSASPPLTSAPPGTLLATLVSPFSFTTTAGTTSGFINEAVFQNPTGTLDFYSQVSNNATSVTALRRETNTSFLGYLVQVATRLDGGGVQEQS